VTIDTRSTQQMDPALSSHTHASSFISQSAAIPAPPPCCYHCPHWPHRWQWESPSYSPPGRYRNRSLLALPSSVQLDSRPRYDASIPRITVTISLRLTGILPKQDQSFHNVDHMRQQLLQPQPKPLQNQEHGRQLLRRRQPRRRRQRSQLQRSQRSPSQNPKRGNAQKRSPSQNQGEES
jgi:hypothetical protein